MTRYDVVDMTRNTLERHKAAFITNYAMTNNCRTASLRVIDKKKTFPNKHDITKIRIKLFHQNPDLRIIIFFIKFTSRINFLLNKYRHIYCVCTYSQIIDSNNIDVKIINDREIRERRQPRVSVYLGPIVFFQKVCKGKYFT